MFPLTPMMLLLGMFYFYTCIRPKFFKKLEEKDYAAHKQRIGNYSNVTQIVRPIMTKVTPRQRNILIARQDHIVNDNLRSRSFLIIYGFFIQRIDLLIYMTYLYG